jgi:tetratricopeptide (TPR) repeat protein
VVAFCATFLAYLPALSGNFIWNDSDYVTAPSLRSLDGLVRIWAQVGATQQYYPLLHSAFWLQHRLWGDNPLGYHLVTLLLHACSAVLFALILCRLFDGGRAQPGSIPAKADGPAVAGGDLPQPDSGVAWLAALLFALHPVHVESVAWITEQKNTLSLAFYLAAAMAYLRFDETRRPRTYLAALALFVCSLFCKTVTATLPAALLVVFWWKRGRLDWRREILPLLPWLALGAAAGLFSSWVEQAYVGAQGADFNLPVVARTLVASRAIWLYAGRVVWPFGLNFVYSRWTVDATVWWQWLFPLGTLAAGAALWILRRRTRGPFAAFLFFVGSLFPVLGFVNLYGMRYSWVWDHWQYLPDLGLLTLAAVGLSAGWRRAALRPGWLGPGLAAALAVVLGALTWAHCGMFHDDLTLYRSTLSRNPACWMAHNNLGNLWLEMPGRLDDAVAEFKEALRLQPDYAEAHNNLGNALSEMPGRLDDAVAEFKEALRLQPDFAGAHNNLGDAWSKMPGRINDAVAQFKEALRLRPGYAEAHNNLGNAWSKMPGRTNDAIAQYEEALRIKPDYAEAHNNLGNVWLGIPGRLDDAVAQYEEALRLRPDFADAHNNLGNAWSEMPGRLGDAVAQYEEALRLRPDFADAHNNLGSALSKMPGRLGDAVAQYEEALRLRPELVEAHNNLGDALSKMPGRLDDAVAQYEEALRLKPDFADAHNNLGNAWSGMPGRLDDAVAQFEEALRLKPDFADAHNNLGNAWSGIPERLNDAVAQYEEALRLRPDYAEAHNNLGNVLSKMPGRLDDAVAQYEQALRLQPDNATIHFNLAVALLKVPDRGNEAVAHLREVVRLQPGNYAARQILARIGPFEQ